MSRLVEVHLFILLYFITFFNFFTRVLCDLTTLILRISVNSSRFTDSHVYTASQSDREREPHLSGMALQSGDAERELEEKRERAYLCGVVVPLEVLVRRAVEREETKIINLKETKILKR